MPVHGVNQLPGLLVAHAQLTTRGGDRAAGVDPVEQVGLAGPQNDVLLGHEPKLETGLVMVGASHAGITAKEFDFILLRVGDDQ
ncbi:MULTISPECIES: hypothetical protein [unclassified Halomonas]|uniref:hypothetical protein n=1 Tax=unclassified Halomonas TaxID=2609666 RepID=UPI00402A5C99